MARILKNVSAEELINSPGKAISQNNNSRVHPDILSPSLQKIPKALFMEEVQELSARQTLLAKLNTQILRLR